MEYRLDLNTLLLMLGQSTGSLSARTQSLPGLKKRCQVSLRLERGKIANCLIRDEQGNELLSGAAAVELIEDLVLEWDYTEERMRSDSGQALIPQQPTGALIPRRTSTLSQQTFMSLPRLHRTVYSLVNGRTSVDHLIMLLRREQGAEQVLEALSQLQLWGLIVFDSPLSTR